MPCKHLQELFDLCEKHDLHVAGRDAVKFVCRTCEEQDVCPSSLTDGEQVLTELGRHEKERTSDTNAVSEDS